MFNLFKRKPPAPAPISPNAVQYVVAPTTPNTEAFKALFVRQGMWVKTEQGVGIVTDAHPADQAVTVMLTDEQGQNKLAVVLPRASISQAALADIPEKRRPSAEWGASKGYV